LLAGQGMLGPFAIDAYLPAIAGIGTALQATPLQMQQTLSAFLLGFAVMNLFHGSLADAYGRRPVVLVGVGVFGWSMMTPGGHADGAGPGSGAGWPDRIGRAGAAGGCLCGSRRAANGRKVGGGGLPMNIAAATRLFRRLPVALACLITVGAGSVHAADAHAPAKAEPKAAAQGKAAPPDNLDLLRERLAEKLGATRPPEARQANLVRVTARQQPPKPDGPDGGAAPSAPPRKPSTAVLAAVDAHRADKAALGAVVAAGQGAPAVAGPAAHWAYGGDTGPAVWGGLKPDFQLCSTGKRQSPIDIRGGIAVDLEPVHFDYRGTGFSVVDNGHTVQVNLGAGNSIQVGGRRYELVQFHFHRPAEERVNGRQYDMSLHLVHKDPEGRLAVVGLLLERGGAQPVVQTVWNNLPLEKGEEQPSGAVLDLNHLLPAERGYYTYMGSLTTPPCSEGVLWMVMRQPVALSAAQIDVFTRLYPMNARPLQQAAGRMIKQSN
jgi:carbonic anhydrase